LALADLDGEGLAQTAGLIAGQAGVLPPLCRELDLSRPGDIAAWFGELGQTWGRLDVLINNAGLGVWKSPFELSIDEWDLVLHTNLRGTFLCSREAARLMKEGGGAVVNIASTRALMSEPHSEAYAASKGGLLALTHLWRCRWDRTGSGLTRSVRVGSKPATTASCAARIMRSIRPGGSAVQPILPAPACI